MMNYNNKIYQKNLNNYVSFIKEKTHLKEYMYSYIINQTLNNKYSKILYINKKYSNNKEYFDYYYKKMFMYIYNENITYLKTIMHIKRRSFNNFIKLIENKKRIYPYFETINDDNIFFYLPIIIDLEKTTP